MPERKRKIRIAVVHILLVPTLLFGVYFFSLAPQPWTGVDEAVVEKVAREHGREAKSIVPEAKGDLQLFLFAAAGAAGGFLAGYCWRGLADKRREENP
jgi:cobalt/nickel transport protein